jgi:hypothetical protein
MRGSLAVRPLVLLSTLALAAACGGGGGGGAGGGPTPLATGTFAKTVDWGASYEFHSPFLASSANTQLLYLANDIKGSGRLQSITFTAFNTETITTCPSLVVKAGHSLLSALTTTFASNLNSGSTQTVFSGPLTIPATASGATYTLTFSQPFDYNGVDNLILQFDQSAGCNQLFELKAISGASVLARALMTVSFGSDTGSLYAASPDAIFTFAGGDNRVSYPSVEGDFAPLDTTRDYNHVQMLHMKSTIAGAGPITGIALVLSSERFAASQYTVNVKLAHTTASALTATFADNYTKGAPTTVASNATFRVPVAPSGTTVWLPITGAFDYNGVDNLIVDIEVLSATGDNTPVRKDSVTVPNSRVYGAVGAATGVLDSGSYFTVFRFNGGKVDVTTIAATAGDNFPFNSTSGMRQLLYLATELGTSGSINEIECRNYGSAGISSGGRNTYKIVMSHLSAATLSTNRAANVPSPVTVVDGAVMMHAGLIAGDYFSIPLTTAFSYNGTDNLVIDISGTGMASGFACALSLDALYTGRRSLGAPTDATVGLETGLPTMRFSISK